MDATYTQGDVKQVISTSGASPSFTMFGGSGTGAYQSIGFGATTDGVWLPTGGAGIFAGGDGSIHLTKGLGLPWRVQPQLGCLLVVELVRGYGAVSYDNTAKANICAIYTGARVTAPSAILRLQPRLQRRDGGRCDPLDAGQELHVLGRSPVVPPRPEVHGFGHPVADGSQADCSLRVQGPGRRQLERPRSAQLLISIV